MIVLSCENICFSFGINVILDNVTIRLSDTDKAGLVGVNGAGKTTLFKILTGELIPDEGSIQIPKNTRIGYLKQDTDLEINNTLHESVLEVFTHLIDMEKELKQLENKISNAATNLDTQAQQKLMDQYANLTDQFEKLGGYIYRSKARGVLNGLGFLDEDFNRPVSSLSGGQKTRLALGRLLLTQPDILMLDEPTNHLDIQAIQWMENYLSDYPGCILVISHDRYFLDKVTNKTLELSNSHIQTYSTGYSGFIVQKENNREIQLRQYENQQKEIQKMETMIQQLRQWNREKSVKRADSKQKALGKITKMDKPEGSPKSIRIRFSTGITSGKDVLFVKNLSKSYGRLNLFKNVNFNIYKNERVFLMGPNGCGKSTLLKSITGIIEQDTGTVEFGHHINLGYYDQELTGLSEDSTVLDEVWDPNPQCNETIVRNTLAAFGFIDDDVFKSIGVLSGGEKSRVLLCRLMLAGHNLLVLDEPTNHLDIRSREELEKALLDFDGTLICVSHDRYFINKLASRIMEMQPDKLIDISGDYDFYAQFMERQQKNMADNDNPQGSSQGKQEYLARKQLLADKRRIERQVAETEDEIHSLETELKDIHKKMSSTEVSTNHEKLSKYHNKQVKIETKLKQLYEQWEELHYIC